MDNEPTSVMYNYVRGRQLEGSFDTNPKTGYSIISACRITKGWGSVPHSVWPYTGNADEWPPVVPENIDLLAKKNRIGCYQRIRSVTECKIALMHSVPVQISIPISDQWKIAKDGIINMPSTREINIYNGHSVLLIGFDDKNKRFKFCNWWGGNWGDEGCGYLPYEYFKLYCTEAWIMLLPKDTREKKDLVNEIMLHDWGVSDLYGRVVCGVEMYNHTTEEFLAWAFAVECNGFLEVEEFFVKPDYRFRNYANQMAKKIKELANDLHLPLRFWVSHIDNDHDSLYIAEKICNKLGLSKKESGVNWASYQFV